MHIRDGARVGGPRLLRKGLEISVWGLVTVTSDKGKTS